ncbi:hypothetical protein Q763_16650 [Flavobacterium beibuense F44-8]|uniref:Uncharacterized protein n=1 Tax=Flavobacterium beibuense F44-8 TaxID=1406840 RepID=A0A0A2LHX1_9FLAO|nr:hypothetical protein [Flavobacterium beibuense]KGO78816.1 hypothetical protein Q763_16650 [Flavobacterium beibuense F44-8]
MKHFLITIALTSSSILFAQQKELFRYDSLVNCEKIHQGIYDFKLYMYVNNSLYIRPEGFKKENIYKLIVDDKLYYITDTLKEIIEKVLKDENCKNVKIEPVDTKETFIKKKKN